MTSSLTRESARHFLSDAEVDAATDKFLHQHGLEIPDFAEMTEKEFLSLFEDSTQGSLDFFRSLNLSRVIPSLLRRLRDADIEFLPNQSVYVYSQLRFSQSNGSVVHRVFVRKDETVMTLCNRYTDRIKKFSVIPFGRVSRKRLCTICSSFNLEREWYRL